MRNPLAILPILVVSASMGCMYHNPYGYYGGGGGSYYGPGYYQSPQQPMPAYPTYPGGTYPPNVNPTPIDGTYTPGGTPGSAPTLSDPPSTFNNNNTPTFKDTPTDRSVPDPGDDPGSGGGTSSREPTLQPTNTARNNDDLSSPFEPDNSTRIPRNFEEPVTEAEPVYQAPLRQTSNFEEPETIQQANREEIPQNAPSFGHHPRFEWIRGIVEYDQQQQCWVMMYDDNPDHADKLGGVVTLADHPGLKRLQDGQNIRIQGVLDRAETDASGKPVYRITKIIKP